MKLKPGMAVRYKGYDSWWIVVGPTTYPVDNKTGEEREDLGDHPDALRLLVFEGEEMKHGWTTISSCDDKYFTDHYEVYG